MLVKGLLAGVVILGIAMIGRFGWVKLDELDSPLGWARQDFPLGEKAVYVIHKKHQTITDEGELEQDAYYFIARVSDSQSQHLSSGRQIGKTEIDLEPFLGKPVHVFGEFYEGKPLLLKQTNLPSVLDGNRNVVIAVEDVREVIN